MDNETKKLKILHYVLLISILLFGFFVGMFYVKSLPVNYNHENFTSALPQYQNQLKQYENLMIKIRAGSSYEKSMLKKNAEDIKTTMDVLRFKLDTTSDENVLLISMCTMQILDLKSQYDKYNGFRNEIKNLYSEVSKHLDQIDGFLNSSGSADDDSEDYIEIRKSRKLIAEVREEARKGMNAMKPINDVVENIGLEINALTEYGELRRHDSFSKYFFTPSLNFIRLLPYGTVPLEFWANSIPSIAKTIFPHDKTFCINFFVLLLAVNTFFIIFGKFFICPHLPKNILHIKEYAESKIWLNLFFLLGTGTTILLAKNWVGATMGMPLTQGGLFVLSIVFLMFAIIISVDKTKFRDSMNLYVPQIVLTFTVKILYCLLIYYSVLVLVLPPLCLLCAIWLCIILWKKSYPILDAAIAIITVLVYCVVGYFAFTGLPYIGFTILMLWFAHVVQFRAALALTNLVIHSVKSEPERYHRNNVFSSLLIPGIWFAFVCSLFINLVNTYHLADWKNYILSPLPLPEKVCSFGIFDIAVITIIFFLIRFLINLCRQLVRDIYKEDAEFGTIPSMMTLGIYIAWSLYILFVMIMFRVNPSGILVLFGGFSVGLGFAMREVLENFIAGIILLAGQHVRPGDIIEFDGIMGSVATVNIRATVVEAWDGSIITLPNTRVIGKDFKNWTRNNKSMCKEVCFGVAYESDLALVRKILIDVAAKVPFVQKHPAPCVLFKEFAASSVNLAVRLWVPAKKFTSVTADYREKVFEEFRKQNINIPFEQIDVHMVCDNNSVNSASELQRDNMTDKKHNNP